MYTYNIEKELTVRLWACIWQVTVFFLMLETTKATKTKKKGYSLPLQFLTCSETKLAFYFYSFAIFPKTHWESLGSLR